jgi:pimeloyl-ACP methyl ester carboxylesterase
MRAVELSAGTIDYDDTEGDGPILVFLTGLLVGVSLWQQVTDNLRHDHRCVVLEMPLGAHHRPMSPEADLSAMGLARLVAEFLERLDLRDVTLIGCDWGGAQLVAAHGLSDRLARLVLLPQEAFDNYPPGLPGHAIHLSSKLPGATTLALQTLRVRPLRRSSMNFGQMSKRPLPPELLDAWLTPALSSRLIRRDLLKYLRTTRRDEYVEAARLLATFDHPALVLWAPESKMMRPANGPRLAAALPNATLIELPDTYTLIPADQPTACANELRHFVAR